MGGGMEANKNRFIEDWSTARENLEYNFPWPQLGSRWNFRPRYSHRHLQGHRQRIRNPSNLFPVHQFYIFIYLYLVDHLLRQISQCPTCFSFNSLSTSWFSSTWFVYFQLFPFPFDLFAGICFRLQTDISEMGFY